MRLTSKNSRAAKAGLSRRASLVLAPMHREVSAGIRRGKKLEIAALAVNLDLQRVEQDQLSLYRDTVLTRVEHRFSSKAAAENWFEHGSVPGYGDQTPRQLVASGRVARVIEAINAIEAGVHA